MAELQEKDGTPVASILLVDDEPNSLYALQEMLQPLGQNLMVARSGAEALRLVLKNEFAVILLDVRMPRMDGFETARLIRERRRSSLTPIIFLTAAGDDMESVYRGYEAGAVDYLIKPVTSPTVLCSKVMVFVELYAKNADLNRQISERMIVEDRLKESEEKLRRLAAYLVSVREEERTHIAREIHDELGQVLTGLKMDVSWLAQRLDAKQKALHAKTQSMCGLIDSAIQTVRKIASGLRPEMLDEMGLVSAIDWQAKDFQKRTGIRCRVELPPDGIKLDLERSTTTFRIFQEILTNVARHAHASRVDVKFGLTDDHMTLEVADNGVGIPEAKLNGKSLGLLGIQERALHFNGDVTISGTAGQGTRVTVNIPLAGVR
ncbi:MAG TPA: response regulator [Burkholderiales bacterium]|jgi:signal transduction histidine kinase|nr:response regulator [Burkholderiales bacterium]